MKKIAFIMTLVILLISCFSVIYACDAVTSPCCDFENTSVDWSQRNHDPCYYATQFSSDYYHMIEIHCDGTCENGIFCNEIVAYWKCNFYYCLNLSSVFCNSCQEYQHWGNHRETRIHLGCNHPDINVCNLPWWDEPWREVVMKKVLVVLIVLIILCISTVGASLEARYSCYSGCGGFLRWTQGDGCDLCEVSITYEETHTITVNCNCGEPLCDYSYTIVCDKYLVKQKTNSLCLDCFAWRHTDDDHNHSLYHFDCLHSEELICPY